MTTEILVPLIIGIVEVLKKAGVLDSKYAPLAALVVGVALSVLGGLTVDNTLNGLIGALVGMGIWDSGKTSLKIAGVVK